MNKEHLTIFTVASIRKFILAAGVGVPVRFMQQGDTGEANVQDEVQVLVNLQFPDRGTKNEMYGIVNITALVKTKIVPTDVYYHTRIKARVADVLDRVIPLLRIGGEDDLIYTKGQFGILRRVPTDTMTISATGEGNPDASVVEAFYEIQPC
jgi:hypothetical protein